MEASSVSSDLTIWRPVEMGAIYTIINCVMNINYDIRKKHSSLRVATLVSPFKISQSLVIKLI